MTAPSGLSDNAKQQIEHHGNIPPFRPQKRSIQGVVLPGVGLCATVFGTLLAMSVVPEMYEDKGALRLPAAILALGIGIAPFVAAMRDIRSAVRIENVLAQAPIYWLLLDLLQGSYGIQVASRGDVVKGLAATGLFTIGVWIAVLQRAWKLPRFVSERAETELGAKSIFAGSIICFSLGIFYFVFKAGFDSSAIISGFTNMRWEAPWSRTSALGGWDAFIEHLIYFGMLLPALSVVLGVRLGWSNPRTILSWLMSSGFSLFQAQGGNRRYLGVMIGAALVVWVLSSTATDRQKSLWLLLWVAAALVSFEVVLRYRELGVAAFSGEGRGAFGEIDAVHVDDNFLRLAQTIHYVPETVDYVWYDYALFALIRPIPRVLWPGKPTAPSFRIQDYFQIGASLSSSVVGELYVSGGLLAVLLGGWLYGCLGTWGVRLLCPPMTTAKVLLYGAWLMALFAGSRSMQDLVMMSYVVLALLAVVWFLEGRPNGSRRVT